MFLFGLAVLAIGEPQEASALPSFARQTGQPCATCHTAFPELTAYGRAFKLEGYTAGGTRCNIQEGRGAAGDDVQIPLAVMTTPMVTHVQKSDPNSNGTIQETSLFVGGQIFCDLGAFVQSTYSRPDQAYALDNTDIRWAKKTRVNGLDVLFGITGNNNPTVQDVWNSTPAWSFPYISPDFAPAPSAATMIEGTFGGRVAGAGAYVWINNMVYAEITAYGALNRRELTTIGQDPAGGPRFAGTAPYWRVAVEKTWDTHSFMVGTFGMIADIQPIDDIGLLAFPQTDHFTDIGVDAQYQYVDDIHAFTVRASYIWERQKLDAEFNNGASANPTDTLNSFKVSASYIYDRTFSLTGAYFNIWGTSDAILYQDLASGFSPNSSGWTAELAILPFSGGGPKEWPWLNARFGVSYTHYDKFDGTSVGASNNDTVFLYSWIAF